MSGYCVICLEDISMSEYYCKEYFNCKCFNNFHNNCIRSWIKKHNILCPLCREELNYTVFFERRRKIGICIITSIFICNTIFLCLCISSII